MPNLEAIMRQLDIIDDKLKSLEFYCETEIVGDDCRHLLSDIKGAMREHTRTVPADLKAPGDLKPLYDRLRSIRASVRVLQNNVRLSSNAIDEAIECCHLISQSVDEEETDSTL
jgi:hypothetical protein